MEPDHIYVIPPKKEMIISAGRLLLSERGRDHDLSLPIDVFFKSLAQDCGPRAVAVVLSGGGSDGSRGARAVHDASGMVIVQDEESAQFDGMPRTVRDAGIADCTRYRRAHALLSSHLSVWRPATDALPPSAPDILDSNLRTPNAIAEVQRASSESARSWNVVTALRPEDFVEALRAAHEAG